jgi:hypothetical protein
MVYSVARHSIRPWRILTVKTNVSTMSLGLSALRAKLNLEVFIGIIYIEKGVEIP